MKDMCSEVHSGVNINMNHSGWLQMVIDESKKWIVNTENDF